MTDLEQKLRPVGLKDRETLLALKKEEHEEKGLPFDGEFYLWDYRYYDRKFIERSLDLDDMLVKEYFPVSKVVPAILEIYQNLLGVKFVEVKGETWHPEVQQFAVWENDAKDKDGFVGWCYLDLFPRGKSEPRRVITYSPAIQNPSTPMLLSGAFSLATSARMVRGATRSRPWLPTSRSRRRTSPR